MNTRRDDPRGPLKEYAMSTEGRSRDEDRVRDREDQGSGNAEREDTALAYALALSGQYPALERGEHG